MATLKSPRSESGALGLESLTGLESGHFKSKAADLFGSGFGGSKPLKILTDLPVESGIWNSDSRVTLASRACRAKG